MQVNFQTLYVVLVILSTVGVNFYFGGVTTDQP